MHEAFVPPGTTGDAMHVTFGFERLGSLMMGGFLGHLYKEWGGKSANIDKCVDKILKASPKQRTSIAKLRAGGAKSRGGGGNQAGETWSIFRDGLRAMKKTCGSIHDIVDFYDFAEDEDGFFTRNNISLRQWKGELKDRERRKVREWAEDVRLVWEGGEEGGEGEGADEL
jgi:hypothetical protein